jgi:hypothetical protein
MLAYSLTAMRIPATSGLLESGPVAVRAAAVAIR